MVYCRKKFHKRKSFNGGMKKIKKIFPNCKRSYLERKKEGKKIFFSSPQ
jgi:hypothetical protein